MESGTHGQVLVAQDVVFGTWDPDTRSFSAGGAVAPNAVRITTRRSAANGNAMAMILAPVLGTTEGNVNAEAIGARIEIGEACVLALAPTGNGITISGNVTIDALQCGFAANSNSPNAAMVANGSSASVDIKSLYLAGGLSDPHSVVHSTEDPITQTGRPLSDPYADRQFSFPSSVSVTANANMTPNSQTTLQPGVYPGGASFKGDVTLSPGVYVMQGDVRMNGGASVSGDGVTMVLDGVDIDTQSGDMDLKAPSTGPTSGIALMRTGATVGDIDLTGNGSLTFNGAVYMPNSDLHFGGTSNPGGCLQVISRTIEFAGNPNFQNNCDPLNGEDIEIMLFGLVS